MSVAASDEEAEELMAALSDDQVDPEEEEGASTSGEDSPVSHSEDDEDENDELHIAARAGIRLLEENMHFREEVLRLNEQIAHLKDEKLALQQTLDERDEQIASLTQHMRKSILESQSVLSELSRTKAQLTKALQENELLQQQVHQRSPKKRYSAKLSPRRSSMSTSRASFTEDTPLDRLESFEGSWIGSPVKLNQSEAASPPSSYIKDDRSSPAEENAPVDHHTQVESTEPLAQSPRRRPTLARLREIEAKYDEEHQRCGSLKLELNFAQRRISELKPLQTQVQDANHQIAELKDRIKQHEHVMLQMQAERAEEHELIQSLRHTIAIYEQLNDPQNRGSSAADAGKSTHQEGGATTAEAVEGSDSQQLTEESGKRHNEQLGRLDRVADMIDGRFQLREESERLLRQLTSLTNKVLSLSEYEGDDVSPTPTEGNPGSFTRRPSMGMARQRYLEQQVSILQDLLRRFRVEWQHAHDARVLLEEEKTELLKQLDHLHSLRRHQSVGPKEPSPEVEDEGGPEDPDAVYNRQLWERTNAICEALLKPTSSLPSSLSAAEEAENELLCFALLRRLVDSWTTDKPQRMKLHDWLINALSHTGLRKPLYLRDLSSEIAMGFQTLLVPILEHKFGVRVSVDKRLHNVIVTDLRIQVVDADADADTNAPPSVIPACRMQRVHHSLLAAIDGEEPDGGGDDLGGEYSIRRASRSLLGK